MAVIAQEEKEQQQENVLFAATLEPIIDGKIRV